MSANILHGNQAEPDFLQSNGCATLAQYKAKAAAVLNDTNKTLGIKSPCFGGVKNMGITPALQKINATQTLLDRGKARLQVRSAQKSLSEQIKEMKKLLT